MTLCFRIQRRYISERTNLRILAKKACGFTGGKLDSFTTLEPKDVEAIYRMCL